MGLVQIMSTCVRRDPCTLCNFDFFFYFNISVTVISDAENIAIMHAFVDQMIFVDMKFTDALRQFLQSFRLPGEAQKIDRFMLKFAERYVNGNPIAFANAGKLLELVFFFFFV